MKKLESNGCIAVVISVCFGAGWSTWNPIEYQKILSMDSEIAQAVLDGDLGYAVTLAHKKCSGFGSLYTGGSDTLTIFWVPKGKQFRIVEYDGSESIELLKNMKFLTA